MDCATDTPDVLNRIERFIVQHDMPITTFGRRAIGDANLVDNLRGGRELRRSTEARVEAFMASYSAAQDAASPRILAAASQNSEASGVNA